ncbi:MAG: hypothetical protein V4596_06015 [Bdellovibrionota bacterium]
MKFFILATLILTSSISFAIPKTGAKYAILCRKAESFDQAVAKINTITTDPQWPIDLAVEKTGGTAHNISVNPKQVKYDMANFKISESEEDVKVGKTSKKTKFYQACVPIEFD